MCFCLPVIVSKAIELPIDSIWNAICNLESYHRWADILISGNLNVGSTVHFKYKTSRSSELAIVKSCDIINGLVIQTAAKLNNTTVSFRLREITSNKTLIIYSVTAVYPIPLLPCMLCAFLYVSKNMSDALEKLKVVAAEAHPRFQLPSTPTIADQLKSLYEQKIQGAISETEFNQTRAQLLGL